MCKKCTKTHYRCPNFKQTCIDIFIRRFTVLCYQRLHLSIVERGPIGNIEACAKTCVKSAIKVVATWQSAHHPNKLFDLFVDLELKLSQSIDMNRLLLACFALSVMFGKSKYSLQYLYAKSESHLFILYVGESACHASLPLIFVTCLVQFVLICVSLIVKQTILSIRNQKSTYFQTICG